MSSVVILLVSLQFSAYSQSPGFPLSLRSALALLPFWLLGTLLHQVCALQSVQRWPVLHHETVSGYLLFNLKYPIELASFAVRFEHLPVVPHITESSNGSLCLF